MRSLDVDTVCALEHLDDGLLSLYFEHLAAAFGTIWEGQLDDFVVGRELATWSSSSVESY